jgi:hypothetical protein
MKKQYTKRQIQEAISYWRKQLRAMNESAGSAVVVPAMDESSQAAFEEQLNGLFGGNAYESLFDSSDEEHTIDGWRYTISLQDLVSDDYFWNFIYDRLNEDFTPGQEVAADEMKKLVKGWADEMYKTCLENFKKDPDPDCLSQDDDGPDPDDWDNGYLYSDRDRDYYPSR